MFSANPSISPFGLKPSDVANGVGLGRECSRTGGERGRTGGERGRTGGNGIRVEGTGSDWGERDQSGGNGVELGERGRIGGNGVRLGRERGRTGRERGSDWGVGLEYKRRGPAHLAPLLASDASRPPAST